MEMEPLTYWKALLHSTAPGLVIDGGAQVGLFTATALSLGHNVLAVDTRPEHVQMILTSLKLNGLESKATVVHAALGDECGRTVTIRQPVEANPGSSQVVEQRRLSLSRFGIPSLRETPSQRQKQFNDRGVVLPMLTLDSLLAALQRRQLNATQLQPVHAVKLECAPDRAQSLLLPKAYSCMLQRSPTRPPDAQFTRIRLRSVEGFEARVFMGSAQLIARTLRPSLIILELFVQRMKRCNVKTFLRAFGSLGYVIDVSARLNLNCDRSRCSDMTPANGKLEAFLSSLAGNAEMDLVLYQPSVAGLFTTANRHANRAPASHKSRLSSSTVADASSSPWSRISRAFGFSGASFEPVKLGNLG